MSEDNYKELYANLLNEFTELKERLTQTNGVAQQGLVLSNQVLERFTQVPPEDPMLLKIVERSKTVKRVADKANVRI